MNKGKREKKYIDEDLNILSCMTVRVKLPFPGGRRRGGGLAAPLGKSGMAAAAASPRL